MVRKEELNRPYEIIRTYFSPEEALMTRRDLRYARFTFIYVGRVWPIYIIIMLWPCEAMILWVVVTGWYRHIIGETLAKFF